MKTINTLLICLAMGFAIGQTYTTGVVNLTSTAGLAMTAKLDIGANVTLTLTGPSTRWFALGFNAASMAGGTDVFGVHTAGALTNCDANLTGYSAPATDAQQNWTITSDAVAAGVRTIIATRALNTGDPNDYIFTAAAGSLSLIWARASSNSYTYAYHGGTNRGIASAIFTLVPATPPPTGASVQNLCAGATVGQLQAVGNSIQWYAASTGGLPIPNNTPLVNGTTYYASQTVNGVESQTRLAVAVTLTNPPSGLPVLINTPASVCSNANSIVFSLNPVANATTYHWNNQTAQSTTNQPTTSFPILAGMTSMTVSVFASNNCGQTPTATATVAILEAYALQDSATACDTLVWNGQVLTSSGNYTYQGTTAAGCDSLVTLQLTILNGSTTDVEISQCTALTMNGVTYNQSGMYQQILPSALGCDSVVMIDFTLDPSYTTSFDTTVSGAFVWNGQTYSQSGSYTQVLTALNSCDSTVTVNLTVMTGSIGEEEQSMVFPTVVRQGEEVQVPLGGWVLYDACGKLLARLAPDETSLPMRWPKGVYLLKNDCSSIKITVIN